MGGWFVDFVVFGEGSVLRGGGEGWVWFCVGGARGVLVVVVFVYRVVF